jgi:hypothetical protein
MRTKELKLKTGKEVVVRELSALEDVLSFRMVGPDFDQNNQFGGGVTVRSIQIALSVQSVDGEEVKPLRKIEDVFEFMTRFTKKEWTQVSEGFSELNEADDEGE